MRSRNAILAEFANEQAKLAELERTQEEARAKIESLRSELAAASATTSVPLPLSSATKSNAPTTSADKIKIVPIFVSRPGGRIPDPVRE